MERDYAASERALLDAGRARLGEVLTPLGLTVTDAGTPEPDRRGDQIDAVWKVLDPDGTARPLDVEAVFDAAPHRLRNKLAVLELRKLQRGTEQLLLADWISPRGRSMLDEAGVHCLDLTGTLHLLLTEPRVAVRVDGAANDPRPPTHRLRGLAGPHAGRLVRILADVAPPYRPGQLAEATRLSPSYITRLLQTLTAHGLITRDGPTVTGVSWPDLLEQRAATTSLLAAPHTGWVAPRGLTDVLERVASDPVLRELVAVTGAHAARAVAPVAAGGQLMLYVPAENIHAPRKIASTLGLLPADEDTDVLLLRAPDPTVFARSRLRADDGARHVAPTQLVLDCLSGPGRLPAAGEAVLTLLRADETWWRQPGPVTAETPDAVT
ncbi:helix-turn-helix domain-containing protein [Yinghuangia aomiensis]